MVESRDEAGKTVKSYMKRQIDHYLRSDFYIMSQNLIQAKADETLKSEKHSHFVDCLCTFSKLDQIEIDLLKKLIEHKKDITKINLNSLLYQKIRHDGEC